MIPLSIINSIKNFITSPLGKIIIILTIIGTLIGYFEFKLYFIKNELGKTISELNSSKVAYANLLKINEDNNNVLKQYQLDYNKTTNSYGIAIAGKNNEISRLKEIIASYNKPIVYKNVIKQDKCELNISEVIKDEKILIGF